jgi:hypothetical protein
LVLQKVGGEARTRKLLAEVKMIGYGEEHIKRAERMGCIRREEREPDSGRGFHPVYNILKPKGRKLLSQLQEEGQNQEQQGL